MSATAQAVLIVIGFYLFITLLACEMERHLRRCAADEIGSGAAPDALALGLTAATPDTFPTEWVTR